MSELVIVRCIGCGMTLGQDPLPPAALEHWRTCEKHPAGAEVASLKAQISAAGARHLAEWGHALRERDEARAMWRAEQEGSATHRCKVCGAKWRANEPCPGMPGGSWSLVSERCGTCCDNVAMGDQIEPVGHTARLLSYVDEAIKDREAAERRADQAEVRAALLEGALKEAADAIEENAVIVKMWRFSALVERIDALLATPSAEERQATGAWPMVWADDIRCDRCRRGLLEHAPHGPAERCNFVWPPVHPATPNDSPPSSPSRSAETPAPAAEEIAETHPNGKDGE